MFELRSGCLPAGRLLRRAPAVMMRLGLCASFLMLGACASRQAQYRVSPQQYAVASQNVRVAGYQRAAFPTEIEDDGIEAQTEPMARRRVEPDDPSEPFSPNYGRQQDAVASNYSDEDADTADVGSDAFDPFLDGPQWKREREIERVEEPSDVVGSSSVEPVVPVRSTQVASSARGLRPGFREKRYLRMRAYHRSTSNF